jgi:putative restriction endonuclease
VSGYGTRPPVDDLDGRVRVAAFQFLTEQTRLHGDSLSRDLLVQGFTFEDQRVPLLGPQGIFKPAVLPEAPLSITTVPVIEGRARPYEDELDAEGRLLYRYRGTDAEHRDNRGLRTVMQRQLPMAYFYGLVPGEYLPVWPVFIVADDPDRLAFHVEVEAGQGSAALTGGAGLAAEPRRRYATITVVQRMHQVAFRHRVLHAYQERCSLCHLRHHELLDAAHILPDGHPRGEPVIPNGLALCKLHHAAFDRHILGIRPDLSVVIRADVLREEDGPMLQHGLQGFQGAVIAVPRHVALRPNREFLAERYELFRRAS